MHINFKPTTLRKFRKLMLPLGVVILLSISPFIVDGVYKQATGRTLQLPFGKFIDISAPARYGLDYDPWHRARAQKPIPKAFIKSLPQKLHRHQGPRRAQTSLYYSQCSRLRSKSSRNTAPLPPKKKTLSNMLGFTAAMGSTQTTPEIKRFYRLYRARRRPRLCSHRPLSRPGGGHRDFRNKGTRSSASGLGGVVGLCPEERASGQTHKVKAFDTIEESIESYLRNVAHHRAYREFRAAIGRYYQSRADGTHAVTVFDLSSGTLELRGNRRGLCTKTQ